MHSIVIGVLQVATSTGSVCPGRQTGSQQSGDRLAVTRSLGRQVLAQPTKPNPHPLARRRAALPGPPAPPGHAANRKPSAAARPGEFVVLFDSAVQEPAALATT